MRSQRVGHDWAAKTTATPLDDPSVIYSNPGIFNKNCSGEIILLALTVRNRDFPGCPVAEHHVPNTGYKFPAWQLKIPYAETKDHCSQINKQMFI